jgi:hypothetical protein
MVGTQRLRTTPSAGSELMSGGILSPSPRKRRFFYDAMASVSRRLGRRMLFMVELVSPIWLLIFSNRRAFSRAISRENRNLTKRKMEEMDAIDDKMIK